MRSVWAGVTFAGAVLALAGVISGCGSTTSSGGGQQATPAAVPGFSVSGGTYTTAQTVTLSSSTPGAQIYYTTNGASPTTASTPYTGPLTVASSETVQAIATASGYAASPIVAAAYVIQLPAPAPTFSVAAGTYTSAQTVTLSDAVAGAQMFYTTDGSAPTAASTPYTGPVTVASSETVAAIAVATGYTASPVASAAYVLNTRPAITGFVKSANPIANAHVYLLAPGNNGYGQASVSLLNAVVTGHSDALGAYVLTGSDGSFSLTGAYTCTTGQILYLYALGGDAGKGLNPGIGLMAAAEPCPQPGAPALSFTVNEISTVAAGYALAGFATDATHMSSSGTPLALQGLGNALNNTHNLINPPNAAVLTQTPAGNGVVPTALIGVLGNVLAGCVENAGACSTLFSTATSDGTSNGTKPTDTATALLNIAHHPGLNVAALYTASQTTPLFAWALTAQPYDLSMMIMFSGAGIASTQGIAIDAQGNVWTLDYGARISELNSQGAPLTSSSIDIEQTGPLSRPVAGTSIAVDPNGNVWAAAGSQVFEVSKDRVLLSPSGGYSGGTLAGVPASETVDEGDLAIDANGNIWVPHSGQSMVVELSPSGALLSPSAGFDPGQQGFSGPAGIAALPGGGVVTSSPSGLVTLSASGAVLSSQANSCSEFSAVAIDAQGTRWVACSYGIGVSRIPASGTATSFSPPYGTVSDIAVDGAGYVWIPINLSAPGSSLGALIELSPTGAEISPVSILFPNFTNISAHGYGLPSLYVPTSVAVDGSGDVWVNGNFPSSLNTNPPTVTVVSTLNEFIGIATPVVTPLVSGVANNTLGTRP